MSQFNPPREFCYVSKPLSYLKQKETCTNLGGVLAELSSDSEIDKISMWLRTELSDLWSGTVSLGGKLKLF